MTFLLKKGSMTAFAVMLILLFSRSALADVFDEGVKVGEQIGYDRGYAAGQATCPGCNSCCPACPPDRYDTGKADGINECKSNPVLCGLKSQFEFDQAWKNRYNEGIDECKSNPALYGLKSQFEFDQAWNTRYQEGYDQGKAECLQCNSCCSPCPTCQVCPTCQDCTVQYNAGYDRGKNDGRNERQPEIDAAYVQGTIDGRAGCQTCNCEADRQLGIEQGINQCKDNPTICGLKTQPDVDAAKAAGIEEGKLQGKEQCQNDPGSCGLKKSEDVAEIDDAQKAAKETCLNDFRKCFDDVGKPDVTEKAIADIKTYCGQNPEVCGIFTSLSNDAITFSDDTKNAIKQYCVGHPDDCGVNDAINKCKEDPTSCGLKTQADVDQAEQAGITEGIQQGKDECKNEPSACFDFSMVPTPFPVNVCDNKYENCVGIPPIKLYFPKIKMEITENSSPPTKINLLQDFEMYFLKMMADGKILFVSNQLEPNKNWIQQPASLKIDVKGDGEGMVVSYPAGIKCDGNENNECQEFYKINGTVELFAVPKNASSVFVGWGECSEESTNQLSLEVTADTVTCTATFEPVTPATPTPTTVTLEIAPKPDNGSITGGAGQINCGTGGEQCNATYEVGESVTLTANPDSTFELQQWEEDCSSDEKNASSILTMTEDMTCSATFASSDTSTGDGDISIDKQVELTVKIVGEGTVEWSSMEGDEEGKCDVTCKNNYPQDTKFELIAIPAGSFTFDGWNHDCQEIDDDPKKATITLDKATNTCTAKFASE